MGWHSRMATIDFFFGTLLENLLIKTGKAVYVVKLLSPVNLIDHVHVLMPPSAQYEIGFHDWVTDIIDISRQTSSNMTFWGYSDTHEKVQQVLEDEEAEGDATMRKAECGDMLKVISRKLQPNDILVVVKARKNTLSYNKDLKYVPEQLDKYFHSSNIVVIYPEQEIVYKDALDVQV